jgi:hypothetical protein
LTHFSNEKVEQNNHHQKHIKDPKEPNDPDEDVVDVIWIIFALFHLCQPHIDVWNNQVSYRTSKSLDEILHVRWKTLVIIVISIVKWDLLTHDLTDKSKENVEHDE